MSKPPLDHEFAAGLAERISLCEDRAWNHTRGYSFAGVIGVSQPTMSRYRCGKAVPSLQVLQKIADLAAVNYGWLLYNSGPPDRPRTPQNAPDNDLVTIGMLDAMGEESPDEVWGNVHKDRISNLLGLKHWTPGNYHRTRLAGLFIENASPGQPYDRGCWVFLDRNQTKPARSWFCLKWKALNEEAFICELDRDPEGNVVLNWPKRSSPCEAPRFTVEAFEARYAILGKIVGSLGVS